MANGWVPGGEQHRLDVIHPLPVLRQNCAAYGAGKLPDAAHPPNSPHPGIHP
ncbi:MAG: hypothetical protein GX665_01925 [Gammaproteobacteria bacterium]|nr:hypothetical protein [Gammaproteobacteria bacterium]